MELLRRSEIVLIVIYLKYFLKVLGKIFRVFDVNSDGTISNKEMKRLVKARLASR